MNDKTEKEAVWKIEYQQTVETFRTQFVILTQVISLLLIANITVVGYALSVQRASPFLAASVISLVLLLVLHGHASVITPIAYRAIVLEKEHIYGANSLISVFMSLFYSPDVVPTALKISEIENFDEQIRELRKMAKLFARRSLRLLIWIAIIGQILIVPLLIYVFQWSLM